MLPYLGRVVQLSALLLAVAGILAGIWRYGLAVGQGATATDSLWLGTTTILLGLAALIALRLTTRGQPARGAYLFLALFTLTLLLNAFLGPALAAQLLYLGVPSLLLVFLVGGERAGLLFALIYGLPAMLLLFSEGAPLLPFVIAWLGSCAISWLLLAALQRALIEDRLAREKAARQVASASQQTAHAEQQVLAAARAIEEALRRADAVERAAYAAAGEAADRERVLSERLALALEDARRLEQLEGDLRRNQPMERLNAALAGARTPAMIAGRSAHVFVEQLALERCDVLRRSGDTLRVVASRGGEGRQTGADTDAFLLPEAPALQEVLAGGRPRELVPPYPAGLHVSCQDGKGPAILAVPLTGAKQAPPLGLALLFRPPDADFSPVETRLAEAMATRIALAIQLVERAGSTRALTTQAALLGRMTELALSAPSEIALYRQARLELFALFDATGFGVLLWDEEGAGLEWCYAYVGGELEIGSLTPAAGDSLMRLAREGKGQRWSGALAGAPDESVGGLAGRTSACRLAVPLPADGRTSSAGLLLLEHEANPEALSQADLEWLGTLAGPLAAGIQNKRLLAALEASLAAQKRQQAQLAVAAEHAAAEHALRIAETEERVRRGQQASDISARLHRAADVDAILALGLQALSHQLAGRGVEAQLGGQDTGDAGAGALVEEWALPGQSLYGRCAGGEFAAHRGSRPAELEPYTGPAFPLTVGERLLGELRFSGGEPLSAPGDELVRTLLREMAAALHNARHVQVAQERASQLQAAVDVSRAISGFLDYDTLTSQLAHLIRRRFGFHFVALFAVSGEQATMLSGDGDLLDELPAPFSLPLGDQTLLGRAAAGNMPHPGPGHEAADPLPAALADTRARLALPLRARGALQGLLDIHSRRENAFGPDEIAVLQGLAGQIAVALDNARLFMQLQDSYLANAHLIEESREHLAELRLLFAVSQAATSSADIGQRLRFIVATLRQGLRGSTIAVYGLGAPDSPLKLLAAEGELPLADAAALSEELEAPAGRAMYATPQEPALEAEAVGSARLSVPLRLGDSVVGLLTAAHAQPDVLSRRELRLLETLAPSLAATIETGRIIAGIEAANERLQELDGLRTRFLANMSHEFRTPLNAIIGFAKVLKKGIDGPLNDLQSEDLRAIEQNAQHLLLLINDVLDMAKIEAGRIELFPDEVNVGELVHDLASTVRGLLVGKPVSLEIDVSPGLPNVHADPTRLRQIMLNLLSNAARYTEAGSIVCRISRPDPDHLLIEVRDTGVGIPQDEQATLFQPFVQTESGMRAGQGTGLGLPITRRLVELHGGEIWFESTSGVGSTFSVRLPLRPAYPAGV